MESHSNAMDKKYLICLRKIIFHSKPSRPSQIIHWSTRTNSAVWPVPYACAQPYHPGSDSYGKLLRPYWSSSVWHSRQVNERGENPLIKKPLLARRVQSTPLSASSVVNSTQANWSLIHRSQGTNLLRGLVPYQVPLENLQTTQSK